MRDALSLLDQAIAHGGGKVEEAQTREMLGTVGSDFLFSILDALFAGDAAKLVAVADRMAARSLSFEMALQGLAALFTQIQLAQFAPRALSEVLPDRDEILAWASRLGPEFVQLAYQIAVQGRKELPIAPDEYAGFVMTLLRLLVFRPAEEEGAPPPARRGQSDAAPFDAGETPGAPRASAPFQKTGKREEPSPPEPAPDAQEASLPEDSGQSVDAAWHEIMASIPLSGMARELGRHCGLSRIEGENVILSLPPIHRNLLIKSAQEKLKQALSDHFGHPVRLVVKLEAANGDTPADAAQRAEIERKERAVASIEQNDFVREAIDLFDAKLIESSIKPV
jgi:DNA polymerase-3 subunit gamma/tau